MGEATRNAIITAGAGIIGQAGSAIAQSSINKATRKWNELMYNKQRQDSLADWTMQNDYNSFTSQMKRLREAGLNPNLVYDNGTSTSAASTVRPSSTGSYNPKAPSFDGGAIAQSALSSIYDTQLKQAQTDNLKKQNTVIAQEALLKEAQTNQTIAGTDATKFDLSQRQRLSDISAEAASLNVEKTKADIVNTTANTASTTSATERATAMQAQTLEKGVQEILNLKESRAKSEQEREEIKARIKNLEKDERLKQLDIDLKEKGIMPNDPLYARILTRLANGTSINSIREAFNRQFNLGRQPQEAQKGVSHRYLKK